MLYKFILMDSDRLTNACWAPLNGKIVHLIGSGRKMHIGSRKTVSQYLRQPLSKFLQIRYYPRS